MTNSDSSNEWLDTVAHDLRTPINLVYGCLDVIQNLGPLNEKQMHYLDRAFAGLKRMEHLIARLKDITWVDSTAPLIGSFNFRLNCRALALTITNLTVVRSGLPLPEPAPGEVVVSDDEVRLVVDWWKKWQEEQVKAGNAEAINIGPWERGLTRREFLSETDPMLEQAITLVVAEGEASAALIQRRLGVGYPRAARIMDLLEELGIVGESRDGGRGRIVLIQPGKDPFKELIERRIKSQKKPPSPPSPA
jgi:signal transduction histidine kinase